VSHPHSESRRSKMLSCPQASSVIAGIGMIDLHIHVDI
jgi:hypothetical protein